jgi:tetratricopeptide (TPR) repeat protein
VQKVIAKASADAFKGSTKPLSEIGSALGVEGLVTGSVLRANDRIRITVQLVRAATGEVVWANRYERSAGDVLALQNDIVGAIAKEVQSKVDAARSRPAATARALNPAAHDAYLKGRSLDAQFAASQWDRPHFDTVIAQFEEAVRLDPTYAPPYAAISMDFQKSSQMSLLAPTESLPRAKAAALKAVELDDGLPEAHAALAGVYLWFDWNWSAAERELRRALDLNPNAFDVLVMSEVFSVLVAGNIDDAVRTSQRVLDIDPLNPFSRIQTVWVAIGARRHDEVVRRARALLDVWPGLMMGQWFLAIDFASQGKRAETEAECGSVMKMLGGAYNMQIVATCAWAYGAVGRHDEARRLLAIVEQPPPGSWLDPAFMGNAYGPLDPDRAFAWYEKGLEQRSPNMIYMKAGMTWDSTRSDPRFPALLRRMNYPN